MKRAILGIIIIVVIAAAVVLVTPIALAGNVNVKVSKITFTENTDNHGPAFGNSSNSTSTVTAYEYYFSIRPAGVIKTTDNKVNSTAGTLNASIAWFLYSPSNVSISHGNFTWSGGFGNRTHTFTFSIDQGLRDSGTYKLILTEEAQVKAASASSSSKLANGTQYNWKVP